MGEFTSAISEPAAEIIAISAEEHEQFGCPYCGYRSGHSFMSSGRAAAWNCGECRRTCVVLAEGVVKSPIGFGSSSIDGATLYPELQNHPRRGTPVHGQPDTRPEEGGEFFRSRGIGLEGRLTCFVCGATDYQHRTPDPHEGGNGLLNNIAAFVQGKAAGERVVALFTAVNNGGARMDYRDYEPDRVQVKVGACNEHLARLRALDEACSDGRITLERIQTAVAS